MQTRVFSTWPCFRPPEMKLRCSCLCRPMPANCNKKNASTSEVQRLHDLHAPPMTNRTCPAHSSSGDTIFVGVHGSSYNSSPSSGGAGPLERHLEAAISRMPSSRQLPPETSRTARPPPTVRRQDRELGLPRLHMARHQNPRVGRGSPELWTSRGSHLEDMPSSRQLRSEIENGPTHPHTVRRHDLVVDDDEVVKNKVDDPVLPAKCAGA